MKKTEIYVPIANKKEAKRAKAVLEALGEPHNGLPFYEQTPEYGGLYFNNQSISKRWCLAESLQGHTVKKITLKQLIELLATGNIKAFEIESKLGELKDLGGKMFKAHNGLVEAGEQFIAKFRETLTKHAESAPQPKIAVRVDNEKEFNALMKYYDGLGYTLYNKCKCTDFSFKGFDIIFVDTQDLSFMYEKDELDNHTIIPFKEFADTHGIRVPLLVSEDGKELFEGDDTFMVYPLEDYKDKVFEIKLHPLHNCITASERAKAFSTKQAAFEWIESQKPKEVVLFSGSEEVKVNLHGFSLVNNSDVFFTDQELIQIYKAYQSLLPF